MKGIVAIDIGTTSTKVTLVNKCGHVFANKCANYSTNSEGSRVEQDPREWWEVICTCLKTLMKENHNFQPVAVTLSGQMQNVILVNNKEVLYPAILYSDMRAKEEARIVQIKVGEELLHQITCNIQDASSLLAKLLWIKKYQPKLYQKSQRLFIGAHDYIAWKLCGAEVTDFTTASVTGMLDLRNNTWAKELMSSLNLRIDWLPDLIPAEKQVGTVNSWASNKTCLPLGVPVFHELVTQPQPL